MAVRSRLPLLLFAVAAPVLLAGVVVWMMLAKPSSSSSSSPSSPLVTAVISVRVNETNPDGLSWDVGPDGGAALPDPTVCVVVNGKRRCHPGNEEAPSRTTCHDALSCEVDTLQVPRAGRFRVEVWDIDESDAPDSMCEGDCELGRTCELTGCTVTIDRLPSADAAPDSP